MTRKPLPKDAARRIREHLATQGITLSQRKALDLVALVEGHNSWQAMNAATQADSSAPAAPTAYEAVWAQVQKPLEERMLAMSRELLLSLRNDFVVRGPDVELGDEYRVAVWVEREFEDSTNERQTPMLMLFTLVEDEQTPGRYALKLSVEDPYESTEYCGWTSGPRFSEEVWSDTAEELLEKLAGFDYLEFLAELKASSKAAEYLDA